MFFTVIFYEFYTNLLLVEETLYGEGVQKGDNHL